MVFGQRTARAGTTAGFAWIGTGRSDTVPVAAPCDAPGSEVAPVVLLSV
jgi:hypothetical protein